ncbi:MAG TPA: FAD-dependent oxidoreductase [Thermoanaerobaculia bacterium]|jgi:NADH:ubiquinone reductase (non-electrogenic)|nr:FAD-dependent oxidoreductase [Thermoanaerobaculia bacterium]
MASPPKLLVLGSGFGGFSLLSRLDPRGWETTLLSPRNYFLFTPLLPSAASGSVEFRSILEPTRRRLRGVRVIEGLAESVDWDGRQVCCVGAVGGERFTLPYDYLVIAVGAAVGDYGVLGVKEHALKLASVEDARAVRRGVLDQFARAEVPGLTPEELRQRLTFVVCGGGPTGVEIAAEIDDLIDEELKASYPELVPQARVVLVEALGRLLTSFDEALSDYTKRHFLHSGIEVRTGAKVKAIEPGRVVLENGEAIPCGLVLWAGGNTPVSFVASLGSARRLPVDEYLRLPGHENVFALGDCAAMGNPPLPATAQVAQQQGAYLAKALTRLRRGQPAEPFRFKASGMLAYIGAGEALADLPQVKWSGRGAWLFWRSVYLTKLVSPANKIKVLFDWIKARLFGRDLSRF